MSQDTPQRWFSLEEQFFKNLDQKLMDELREKNAIEQTAESIMQLTGLNDRNVAQKIAQMKVSAETLTAFRLIPLVEVAWASESIDDDEKYAIDQAAEKAGLEPVALKLLGEWTKSRPVAALFETWQEYASALALNLDEGQRTSLRNEIVKQATAVAQASGGVLGWGSISPSEKATIEKIKQALA